MVTHRSVVIRVLRIMLRHTLILILGVVVLHRTQSFKIIGHVETPYSGLLKDYKAGGGKDFEAVKHAVKGERGDRGYAAHHAQEKGLKGFHDKEDHQRGYAESAGNKKAHNHDDGYYAEAHKGEKGDRGFAFADKGSYAKGHDTKGHHNIHKLNEYKKKTDFFDEDHDEAHKENHGGFEVAKAFSSGVGGKAAHGNKGYQASNYGKLGHFDKGHHYLTDRGHKKAGDYDGFFDDGASFAKKGGDKFYKDFGFHRKGY